MSGFNNQFKLSSPKFGVLASMTLTLFVSVSSIIIFLLDGPFISLALGIIFFFRLIYESLYLAAINQRLKNPVRYFRHGFGKYESLAHYTIIILYLPVAVIILSYGDIIINKILDYQRLSYLMAVIIASIISGEAIRIIQNKMADRLGIILAKNHSFYWKRQTLELSITLGISIFILFLIYFENYESGKITDLSFASAFLIFDFILKFTKFRHSFKSILEENIPEKLQFDLLTIIADNFDKICEFKSIESYADGEKLYITLNLVLPFDLTLEKKFELEEYFKKNINKLYPDYIFRIYSTPCDKKCLDPEAYTCPVRSKTINKS